MELRGIASACILFLDKPEDHAYGDPWCLAHLGFRVHTVDGRNPAAKVARNPSITGVEVL